MTTKKRTKKTPPPKESYCLDCKYYNHAEYGTTNAIQSDGKAIRIGMEGHYCFLHNWSLSNQMGKKEVPDVIQCDDWEKEGELQTMLDYLQATVRDLRSEKWADVQRTTPPTPGPIEEGSSELYWVKKEEEPPSDFSKTYHIEKIEGPITFH